MYPETEKFLIYVLDGKQRPTFREVSSLPLEFQRALIDIIAEDIFHFNRVLSKDKLDQINQIVKEKAFPDIAFIPQFKAFVRVVNKTVYTHWNGLRSEKDIIKFRETLFSNDRIFLMDICIIWKIISSIIPVFYRDFFYFSRKAFNLSSAIRLILIWFFSSLSIAPYGLSYPCGWKMGSRPNSVAWIGSTIVPLMLPSKNSISSLFFA